ncbi:MAG: hypothetical protein JNM83_13175 [Myxococcales bacterium]|jgi:hypothetical protein|nr:hypothetical protein [Myxococcales bacterium]
MRCLHVLLIGVWLAVGSVAWAESPSRTLVLSVEENLVWHRALHHELEERLRRRGAVLIDSLLTDGERGCREEECLMKLGHGHGAHNLLFASYQPKHQRLDVFLFDVQTGKRTRRQEDVARPARTDRLTELSAALLQLGKEPPPSVMTSRELPSPTGTPTRLPKWRVGLGVTLGVISLGAMTTAIWAHAVNGQEMYGDFDGVTKPAKMQTMPLFVTGYAVAGAAALSAGLTFFWPSTPSQEVRK